MKFPVIENEVQVRYSDTDAMGHISNEAYISFLQVGRLAMFRELEKLSGWKAPVVVVNINIDYLKECFYGDDVRVTTWCSRIGTKSFTLGGEVRANGQLVARGSATHAGFDEKTRRALVLPTDWEISDYDPQA